MDDVQNAARANYKAYIDTVMSSKFNEHGLKVVHNCDGTIKQNVLANDLFYGALPGHPNENEQLQCIQDSRSEHKVDKIGGKI